MAVTFDANATVDTTATAALAVSASNLTIGAGSNRALVVQIIHSGSIASLALTWDNGGTNQAMAAITNALATQGTNNRAELWGLVNPISGAKTLRATWTTARDVVINGVSWTGVDQTGGVTSFPHGANASNTTTGIVSAVTVTSATNNATMAAVASQSTISAATQTATFTDNSLAASAAGQRAAGAASVAFGWTFTGTAGWAAVGTDIAIAAGVTTTTIECAAWLPPRRQPWINQTY